MLLSCTVRSLPWPTRLRTLELKGYSYASFVYGILYLYGTHSTWTDLPADFRGSSLAALPLEFAEERGWGPVVSEIPFLGLLLGTILGGGANASYSFRNLAIYY
jgi:hypothetical protein